MNDKDIIAQLLNIQEQLLDIVVKKEESLYDIQSVLDAAEKVRLIISNNG
jgi:hypothetical protein